MPRNITPDIPPFLKIIIPACCGIMLAEWFIMPLWVPATTLIACLILGYRLRTYTAASYYLWFGIVLLFFCLSLKGRPESNLPMGSRIAVTAVIEENPSVKGRWQRTSATVVAYRTAPLWKDEPPADPIQLPDPVNEGSHAAYSHGSPDPAIPRTLLEPSGISNSGWIRVSEKILLSVDTCYAAVKAGERIAFRGWINPIDTSASSYGRLMARRGFHGRMYLVPGNMLYRDYTGPSSLRVLSSHMQGAAISRIGRLGIEPGRLSVVSAMAAGDKRDIPVEIRQAYNQTGAAHILAVSGLHVGMVFVLVNLLLYPVVLLPRGHIIKNIVAVALIWAFAFMAGLSPSVIRAAMMFSFAQMALAFGTMRDAVNVVLGCAAVMLALNPSYALEPGFLMSYTAVLSILLFFGPAYEALKTGSRLTNVFISIMLVGIAASVGTAPLVAYYFGHFPMGGLLLNPVLLFTGHIIVLTGVLWVVFPFEFLSPVFSVILDRTVALQNTSVGFVANQSWATVKVDFPLWAVFALYGFYILCAAALRLLPAKEKGLTLLSG